MIDSYLRINAHEEIHIRVSILDLAGAVIAVERIHRGVVVVSRVRELASVDVA